MGAIYVWYSIFQQGFSNISVTTEGRLVSLQGLYFLLTAKVGNKQNVNTVIIYHFILDNTN